MVLNEIVHFKQIQSGLRGIKTHFSYRFSQKIGPIFTEANDRSSEFQDNEGHTPIIQNRKKIHGINCVEDASGNIFFLFENFRLIGIKVIALISPPIVAPTLLE